jgi:hypothetical protein
VYNSEIMVAHTIGVGGKSSRKVWEIGTYPAVGGLAGGEVDGQGTRPQDSLAIGARFRSRVWWPAVRRALPKREVGLWQIRDKEQRMTIRRGMGVRSGFRHPIDFFEICICDGSYQIFHALAIQFA